jgi:hypothetical protein
MESSVFRVSVAVVTDVSGSIGCPEASVTTTVRYAMYKKSEDHIFLRKTNFLSLLCASLMQSAG